MYWDNLNDNTLDLADTAHYSKFENMKPTTPEGYRCDPLVGNVPVLYMGSCDINGAFEDESTVWSRIAHARLVKEHGDFPYNALARIHTGTMAMARRLYTYCSVLGPPKEVLIVVPRQVSMEVPKKNGVLINISERERFPNYLKKVGKVDDDEHKVLTKSVDFARSLDGCGNHHLYKWEHFAMMLQLMSERWNFNVRWVPGIAGPATIYFSRWLELFLEHTPWMVKTCAGAAVLAGQTDDASANPASQQNIADRLLDRTPVTLAEIIEQTKKNEEIMKELHPLEYQRLNLDATAQMFYS